MLKEWADARIAVAGREELGLVRHSQLSEMDRWRIERALRADR